MKLVLSTAVVACLLAASAAHGQILVNGGFENEPQALNPNSPPQEFGFLFLTGNQVPGWTIAPGHWATLHENPGPWPTITGAYSLNTDGEGQNGNNVDIYQDFASTSGAAYSFSFDWLNWVDDAGNSQLQISIVDTTTSAALFDQFYGQGASFVVNHVLAGFTGTGDTLRLEIQETPQTGYNDNTWIVDNFDVETAGVPDSTTWTAEALAITSVLGMAVRLRKARA